MADFRFRPREHLRSPADFRRVYERRRSASDERIIVYGCENGLPYSRLGLSVSRKVGPATRRNRLRRLYREAYRLTRAELPTGLDLIIIPRPCDGAEVTLEQLKESLIYLVGQVGRRIQREAKKS
jgi:ribonuclease P protein component